MNLFHYTDRDGWNSIRSQPDWKFQTAQPQDQNRPPGAYFTDIEPSAMNLRTLHKKIRIPKAKQQYLFWFTGSEGLSQLNSGRGRDKRIFFSATDYDVISGRQKYEGDTNGCSKEFP